MLSRRGFVLGATGLAAGTAWLLGGGRSPVYGQPLGAPAQPQLGPTAPLNIVAAERQTALPCFGGHSLPLWTFSDDTWLPIVRIPLGARLDVALQNRLPRDGEHASIHWHGIRLPNDQDGVPYLVQDPVFPGDSYSYSFVPPDTGTFFFHTHCNTPEHFGRGLVGILIVEGDTTEPYDADELVLIRDWRVDVDAGDFLSFTTARGEARAGTYGPLRSVNGAVSPEIVLPSSADCRLRLINVDPTRVIDVGVQGADAAIVAIDGIPVAPLALGQWLMGPAMRLDIVVRSPRDGGVAQLVDFHPDEPLRLVSLRSQGPDLRAPGFAPAPLRAGIIPEPDLAAAETLTLDFGSIRPEDLVTAGTPLEGLYLGPLCRSTTTNWTINEAAWPASDHSTIPAPVAALTQGATCRMVLRNRTRLMHPIHIHGHSFAFLSSDQRSLPAHYADTFLLLPDETAELAFVADNPGKWMIHCHIAEHQETGMMGYFTVG